MKFKNYKEYMDLRNVLIEEANNLLAEGDVDGSNAKQEEIKQLDNDWDNYAKAQANLNALNNVKPAVNVLRNGVVDTFNSDANDDIYNSDEYKKAFMNYVAKGESIPAQLRNADAVTKTSDVGEVIPTTTMQKIVEKMEATGMILPLVTRTAYKGGVTLPTSNVKPVATWAAEGAGSDKQKKTTGSITFGYHKLRCAISSSLEVDTMSYPIFETTFVNNVAEAMVKAQEQAIINGSGNGKPKGILAETAPAGQNIEVAADEDFTYGTLIDAEAALPLAYENGAVWFMTKKTFMAFVGMTDENGQPIARVNYGINGKPERSLLGRQVILNDYMTSLGATIANDTVVAFLFNPKDYILNTNLNMTIKRYEDNNTDDQVTKAIMLVDGKVVDKNSLVTITKKVAAGSKKVAAG